MRRLPHLPLLCLLICFLAPRLSFAQPGTAATAAFDAYVATIESRLAQQHRSPSPFLAPIDSAQQSELRQGHLMIDHIDPPGSDPPGAIIHHWRGTAFAPGAHLADFERLMRDFPAYPTVYAPQVVRARVLSQNGDHFQLSMRLRQQQVLIVVLDTDYDVTFVRLDPAHISSLSRSTHISEVNPPGDFGFLWRLNTYWSCEERDGGLYLQIETVSLTRSIPPGLGWAVKPFIETVPRQSLEFTLRSTVNALHK